MPVLTRKRKAELEAAVKTIPIQTEPRTEQPIEEPSLKRQKLTDPLERTDPFRPHSPPPKIVIRRRRLTTQPKQPLPVVFFTIPTTNPSNQVSAKGRSSNNADTIILTKSLFEHVDKYGISALPTKEALDAWLEENKDTFIQARKERDNQQTALAQSTLNAPSPAIHPEVLPETPAPEQNARHNVAAGPPMHEQHLVPVADQRMVCRAVRTARHTAARLLNRAASILENPTTDWEIVQEEGQNAHLRPRLTEKETSLGREKENTDIQDEKTNTVDTEKEPRWIRPAAPPLDTRFFHPNGQLQSVYQYLTAQIPLPRQWVQWAINNGVGEIPGRGDIREPGIYIADDTFDYDALFEAIHRGTFRTGRFEIDGYGEYWPMVRGRKDSITVDLTLHHFSARPSSGQGTGLDKQKGRQLDAPPLETVHIQEAGSSSAFPAEQS
ncbi:hypothetical protein F4811DRAFT_569914 [Daldinia bambusicola]|nr:hypothetical protein F4811DRAFT_569914 [Daldinia bambusicola]